MSLFSGRLNAGDQKRLAFIFGVLAVVFVLLALVLTFMLKMHEEPKVWALVEFFLRTVIALCAGGIASCLPGFLDIDWGERMGIRAGGAVGVFALVFLVNPPSLMADAATSRDVVSTYDFCKEGIKFDKDIGEDVVSVCEGMQSVFPDHFLTELVQAKLALVRGEERAAYHITRSAMLLSINGSNNELDTQELQDAAKSISHTLRNVTYTFPAPAWSRQISGAVRQQVGLPETVTSREHQLFDQMFYLSNTAAWLREELADIEDTANEGDALFMAMNSNRSKPLFVSFCARSWSDFLLDRAVRPSEYQERMNAIFDELERQTGTQGTKRRIACLKDGRVCEDYALAVQWCPGLDWVNLPA